MDHRHPEGPEVRSLPPARPNPLFNSSPALTSQLFGPGFPWSLELDEPPPRVADGPVLPEPRPARSDLLVAANPRPPPALEVAAPLEPR